MFESKEKYSRQADMGVLQNNILTTWPKNSVVGSGWGGLMRRSQHTAPCWTRLNVWLVCCGEVNNCIRVLCELSFKTVNMLRVVPLLRYQEAARKLTQAYKAHLIHAISLPVVRK